MIYIQEFELYWNIKKKFVRITANFFSSSIFIKFLLLKLTLTIYVWKHYYPGVKMWQRRRFPTFPSLYNPVLTSKILPFKEHVRTPLMGA